MDRFSGFEDAQLEARLARSQRAEQDLQERVAKRISQVSIEGRWLRSDPLYQRLSSILSQVREDIKDAEQELFRRRGAIGRPGPALVHARDVSPT